MTTFFCIVILTCIALSGLLGVKVGRMLAREGCERRLKEHEQGMAARLLKAKHDAVLSERLSAASRVKELNHSGKRSHLHNAT